MHDRARDADLVLGDSPVDLRDAAHHLERNLEEQLADSLQRRTVCAAQKRAAVVELMTENDPEHGSDGTGGHEADDSADRLTEPLHRSSARK